MNRVLSASFPLLLVGALIAIGGCGQTNLLLVPVEGRVTLDGEPLPEVVVTFTPIGATLGNGAVGGTAADGRFTLTDVRGEPGAHAGEYRVSLYPTPVPNPSGAPTDVVSLGATSLPAIYINPHESPLRATVPPGGCTLEVVLTRSGEGATVRAAAGPPES